MHSVSFYRVGTESRHRAPLAGQLRTLQGRPALGAEPQELQPVQRAEVLVVATYGVGVSVWGVRCGDGLCGMERGGNGETARRTVVPAGESDVMCAGLDRRIYGKVMWCGVEGMFVFRM